jgi:hypothetical protein
MRAVSDPQLPLAEVTFRNHMERYITQILISTTQRKVCLSQTTLFIPLAIGVLVIEVLSIGTLNVVHHRTEDAGPNGF